MNEAARRQKLAQAKARREDREREERTLHASKPTVYDVTVENASSPGLPPPFMDRPPRPSTAPPADVDDLEEAASGGSTFDDVILGESEHVLADYVEALGPRQGALARE